MCAARVCAANSLLFAVHACLSTSSMCISTVQARKICLPGASNDCALVVVPCAFSHMVLTFRGRRKGNLFGAPKSTFRDRCKASELFYFEMQFSWQVQHFGPGRDRRGAQIS